MIAGVRVSSHFVDALIVLAGVSAGFVFLHWVTP